MSIKQFLGVGLTGLVLSFAIPVESLAQVAVKNNLLYDATTTPNIGLEMGVGRKSTIQLFYGLNPWEFDTVEHGERKAKHWLLMPEYRYWTCTMFNGHFFGIHALCGQFNAANVDLPFPGKFFNSDNLRKELRNNNYEGTFVGAGLTYGYQWILNRHFNLEAEIGAGCGHIWYDKYKCGKCGAKVGDGVTNYAGLTKIGISVVYLF